MKAPNYRHATYEINVSMDQAQLLHVSHLLLHQQIHLRAVVLDAGLFILNRLQFSLQAVLHFLKLNSFIPERKDGGI